VKKLLRRLYLQARANALQERLERSPDKGELRSQLEELRTEENLLR